MPVYIPAFTDSELGLDLAGYNVYRSTSAGGPYPMIASNRLTSDYVDLGVANGTTYYYVVAAVNTSGQVSPYSGVASATPAGGGSSGGAPA